MREKVGKSRNTVFFKWFVAPEGRKVGSLKRRVRSQLATGAMKNCTPLWREAHFQVKSVKNWRSRTTFGSWDVKKVHAVVARSTFPSQNVQNTPASDHFWKLRCRKSARRCGAKHISKSKVLKTDGLGPLFWSSDVEKVHAVVARSTFRSQMLKTLGGWTTFGGSDVLPFASLNYTTLHYTLHCARLHYTTLHNTTTTTTQLHSTTLHYTKPHYIALRYITLNDTAPQIDR